MFTPASRSPSAGVFSPALLYTDGGARGNPGPAAIGVVLHWRGRKYTLARRIGRATNNEAEYLALLAGLRLAQRLGVKRVHCRLDAELVVRQLKRQYKVRDKRLGRLFVQVWNTLSSFQRVTFESIPRRQNREADSLLNRELNHRPALDKKRLGKKRKGSDA
ncbi:MAG TPA: ribonuclease HI family protein [Planctomycetaceae bacterium]|nr:ribonuclease HI family protein [Planctomycetaceae bacterium]